ncbi:MAG: hypothetical protein Ct9H300mP28_19290 [Pseudomonadota bacterium]|nr:MAG: hypothetical protein Ct9H300mP28_19290 [Pseudomonadota bacterium]
MENVENGLRKFGFPKINCQIRKGNDKVFHTIKNLALLRKRESAWVKGLKMISDYNSYSFCKHSLLLDKLCLNF